MWRIPNPKYLDTYTPKILTKIILGRTEKKTDENLAEDQSGFRKNGGKREAILFLWNIVEKSFTVNKKVYIVFVDLLKDFNSNKYIYSSCIYLIH